MSDPGSLGGTEPESAAPFMLTARNRGDSPVVDIARQLLSQLLAGQIAPGTRLPSERQLAETLDVGRSTVREALKALDVLGIIDVRLGDGTYLKQGTSDLLPKAIEWGLMLGQPQARDLVESRQHLEVVIAELAAARADDHAVAELERHLGNMRSTADGTEFVEADVEFHLALASIADNMVLNDILVSIRSLLRVWIRRAITEGGGTEGTIREHSAVLEAVRNRSPGQARVAMQAHMEAASERLHDSLRKTEP